MGHGYDDARALVLRELDTQRHLAEIGKPQTLNIPCVLGPPGMGKTALGRDVAQHYDLMPLIISCGENSDPTDVAGIPVPVPQSKDGMQFIDWYQNKAASRCASKTSGSATSRLPMTSKARPRPVTRGAPGRSP